MTTDLMELQQAINAMVKRTEDAYHRAARAAGLSDAAFDILYALRIAGEGCSQSRLSELCFTRKQTVNSAIKRMQEDGTVRLESGPGRATHVYLTEQGHTLIAEHVIPVINAELTALACMPAQARAALSAALSEYTHALIEELDAIGGI
ncbi:MarR family winged helix-turn-helix transcriptional regulator [Actinomyces sp.]|uniref:MarR family winged helix-turn-helix transcriptional regulator n=1 Tax=Actinomyces sp. TaxID=29317 RepID=UPI0026DC5A46|nr:helix-turn-helix domain-containing protein [Actinomyces sp.]MDO4900230.1 helix-turn-helix domain-containing protein [Actinomyces sp.]